MSSSGKVLGLMALFALLWAGSWSTALGQQKERKKEQGQPAAAAAKSGGGLPGGLGAGLGGKVATAGERSAEQKIRAALQGDTVIEFVETPLSDVVDYLKDFHKIEIQLDTKALDEAGIGSDVPMTRTLRGISLAAALKLLLKPLDMTAVYANEVLLLTTVDEAGTKLRTRIYNVSDLLEQDRLDRTRMGEKAAGWDYEALVKYVQTVIAPRTWEEAGGPGSIGRHLGLLAVSQTDHVHEQFEAFLNDTRRAIEQPRLLEERARRSTSEPAK